MSTKVNPKRGWRIPVGGIPPQAGAWHDGRGGLLFGPRRRSRRSLPSNGPPILTPTRRGGPPGRPVLPARAGVRSEAELRPLFEDGHAAAAAWNVVARTAAAGRPAGELAAVSP